MNGQSTNGKICYLQIPATDIKQSVKFYKKVFGWEIRHRDDGRIAFDDGIHNVSGEWVTDRKPTSEAGIRIYIMVDSLSETIAEIQRNGGEIIPTDLDSPEMIAQFRDPVGNIFGIYQEPC